MLVTMPSTATTISNKSQKNTHAIFVTNYGTITVDNIQGHEESTYRGFYHVFTTESDPRYKAYFDVISSDTPVDADSDICGEFEYSFS
jgi:hypothetical protein